MGDLHEIAFRNQGHIDTAASSGLHTDKGDEDIVSHCLDFREEVFFRVERGGLFHSRKPSGWSSMEKEQINELNQKIPLIMLHAAVAKTL
jgi:hypothetical protein